MSEPQMPQEDPRPEQNESSGWNSCWYALLVLAGIGLLFFGTCLLMVSR